MRGSLCNHIPSVVFANSGASMMDDVKSSWHDEVRAFLDTGSVGEITSVTVPCCGVADGDCGARVSG